MFFRRTTLLRLLSVWCSFDEVKSVPKPPLPAFASVYSISLYLLLSSLCGTVEMLILICVVASGPLTSIFYSEGDSG